MIVWLNTDGSVGEIVSSYVLTDSDGNEYSAFSQREGNLAAGGIFVYFEGGNPSGGLAYSAWTLPTGSVSPTAYKASWKKDCTIGLDKSRDMRKFKAEKAYEMQYFPFPDGLISEGGNGVYKVGITDSVDNKTYAYGPVLFSVAENSVVKETTLTKTEYAELKADVESKADKSVLEADYQLQYSSTNVRGYFAPAPANVDLANLAEYQLVITPDSTNNVGRSYELYYVDSDGGRTLTNLAIGLQGNKDYFLWKKDLGEKSDVQNVFSGFVSQYEDADGNQVNFGTDEVTSGKGFYVNVLDKSNNYTGAISLGAKNYKFAYDSLVDVFSSDGNTTAIKSPMGNASVELTNADGKVYGTNVYIGTKEAETTDTSSGVLNLMNMIKLQGNAGLTINAWGDTQIKGGYWRFKTSVYFDQPVHCDIAPEGDDWLTNKSYVDKTAEAQATEKANAEQSRAEFQEGYLQDQIDAINASQNFVATFATHQDLVNIDMSKLDYSDCVLILKDEDHNDQSTVYRFKSGSGGVLDMFEFVGELGDYYTKAQINEKVNALNASITSAKTECKAYADTEVGKAKDALRYFYLDEEGYLCLDYDKITA